MKKIILIMATLMIMPISITFANETPQMPTDAEIMQVIKTFNFTPEEQAYLFKETKKELQNKLNNGTIRPRTIPVQNQVQKTLEETQLPENSSAQEILQNPENANINSQEEIQKLLNQEAKPQVKPQRVKKYSKHEPLTRRKR